MNKIFFLSFVLFFMGGCAGKPVLVQVPGPELILTGDPIPKDTIDHIIKRCGEFCGKRGPVKRIKAHHDETERHTSVLYTCIHQ